MAGGEAAPSGLLVANDYKKADGIREHLKAQGIILMDEKHARGDLLGEQVTTWRHWQG